MSFTGGLGGEDLADLGISRGHACDELVFACSMEGRGVAILEKSPRVATMASLVAAAAGTRGGVGREADVFRANLALRLFAGDGFQILAGVGDDEFESAGEVDVDLEWLGLLDNDGVACFDWAAGGGGEQSGEGEEGQCAGGVECMVSP